MRSEMRRSCNHHSPRVRGTLVSALCIALVAVFGMAQAAFAADTVSQSGFANSKDKEAPEYKYSLEVDTGMEGTFRGSTKWTDVYDVKTGSWASGAASQTIDIGDVKVTNDKYYVRGFRIAGHDNDETTDAPSSVTTSLPTGFTSMNFAGLTEDITYEVAYGIKGAMVAYVVQFVDEDGQELAESKTYYGMAGDKPVVAYTYVEGYTPNAYNLAKTLSEDESQNVFTFTYTPGEQPTVTTRTVTQPAAPGTAANPAGTAVPAAGAAAAGANANANAGNNTANIADGDTPLAGPQQFADLDDGDTPLAAPGAGGSHLPLIVGLAVGALLLIALVIWLFLRRRRAGEGEQ